MSEKRLRVAIIAPPWLALPIKGYGGIELVLDGLIDGLRQLNVDVEVFGNGEHVTKGIKTYSLYKTEQYKYIHHPMYESLPVLGAHLQFALTKIKEDGNFDIIHDHTGFYGAQLLAWATADPGLPPVVSTHHGPPFTPKHKAENGTPSNYPYWEQLGAHMGRTYIVGISDALMRPAPRSLKPHILAPVHNAIELDHFKMSTVKKNYFITLARFAREKGQHYAVRMAVRKKLRLRMAGTVASIASSRKLLLELANPMSQYRSMADFRYYSDEILPHVLRHPKITYSGNLNGLKKQKFIGEAKALLFPIEWDEPFGMAVIEALACGTPVIAMNRGAMPEIIEHGVNGFLADTLEEFEEYIDRIDEINPEDCRRTVAEKFSSEAMAQAYLDRYHEVVRRDAKERG